MLFYPMSESEKLFHSYAIYLAFLHKGVPIEIHGLKHLIPKEYFRKTASIIGNPVHVGRTHLFNRDYAYKLIDYDSQNFCWEPVLSRAGSDYKKMRNVLLDCTLRGKPSLAFEEKPQIQGNVVIKVGKGDNGEFVERVKATNEDFAKDIKNLAHMHGGKFSFMGFDSSVTSGADEFIMNIPC